MPKFETVRRVPHSAEKMFAVVADIERYPEFLPNCESLQIVDRFEEQGVQVLHADMTVRYKGISETFRSEVTLDLSQRNIKTVNVGGPFQHMENCWRFVPLSETSTDVHFALDYSFKNWALEKLMGGLFEKAYRTYAENFEQRANVI